MKMGLENSIFNGNIAVVEEEGESSNGNGQAHMPEPLNESFNCDTWGVLPPMEGGNPNKKTLVLDLDQTLVDVTRTPMPVGYHFSITFPGRERPSYYVLKRPGVDELLQKLGATGLYEIVLFTAASKEYADAVMDGLLDSLPATEFSCSINRNIIPPTHRLASRHCRIVEGDDVKDLSLLGRDLKNVIFVDDRPWSYYLQPENAIPINEWVGEDTEDKSLFKILTFCLRTAHSSKDVRELIYNYRCFGTYD